MGEGTPRYRVTQCGGETRAYGGTNGMTYRAVKLTYASAYRER